MKRFDLKWRKSAEKELNKLPKEFANAIAQKIENLPVNPFPINFRKLKGVNSSYRLRIGDYRVIYQILDKERIIIINNIRHRKDAYKDL